MSKASRCLHLCRKARAKEKADMDDADLDLAKAMETRARATEERQWAPLFGGKGAGVPFFDGDCNHCGKHGHRKMHCPELDKELAARRAAAAGG